MSSSDVNKRDADILALIKLVEERPVIWDKANTRPQTERKQAWAEICEQFEPRFPHMEEAEQEKLTNFLQGKWQHVRDHFVKCAKHYAKKNLPREKVKYRFFDELSFLLKNILGFSNTFGHSAQKNPAPKTSSAHALPRNRKRKSPFYKTREQPTEVGIMPRKGNSDSSDDEIDVVSTAVAAPEPKMQSTSTMDEDQAFFMSIMSSVKKLSENEKLDFRMEVLKAVRDIKMRSEMEQTSVYAEIPYMSGESINVEN